MMSPIYTKIEHFFILLDFPMHIDRISMELPILYSKGSQVDTSTL